MRMKLGWQVVIWEKATLVMRGAEKVKTLNPDAWMG
jgi:hypothetical protein